MTLSQMEHDLDRMITVSKHIQHLSHPREAEILTTIHRWNNDKHFVPEVIVTDIKTDLPHIIGLMVDVVTEKGNAQDD